VRSQDGSINEDRFLLEEAVSFIEAIWQNLLTFKKVIKSSYLTVTMMDCSGMCNVGKSIYL